MATPVTNIGGFNDQTAIGNVQLVKAGDMSIADEEQAARLRALRANGQGRGAQAGGGSAPGAVNPSLAVTRGADVSGSSLDPGGNGGSSNGPPAAGPAKPTIDRVTLGEGLSNFSSTGIGSARGVGTATNQALTNLSQQSQAAGNAARNQAVLTGQRAGDDARFAGTQASLTGQAYGSALANQANLNAARGQAAAGRGLPATNFTPAQSYLNAAGGAATSLANLEAAQGPSAAQAQLQAGLNRAQAQNLALARSGRGFGGSASALQQAQLSNAAMAGEAANASAMLRAQEDAAFRQRAASNLAAAGGLQAGIGGQFGGLEQARADLALRGAALNDQTALAYQGLGLQGLQAGAGTALQGQLGGGQLALAGSTAQGQLGVQGGQAQLAGLGQAGQQLGAGAATALQGEQLAQDIAGRQAQADLGTMGLDVQRYGIDKGVAVQNQANTNSLVSAGLSAAAVGLLALSDRDAKTNIMPENRALIAGKEASEKASKAASEAGKKLEEQNAKGSDQLTQAVSGIQNAGAQLRAAPGSPLFSQFAAMGAPGGMPVVQPLVSDEREKTNVRRAAGEAMSNLDAYSYDYKDPERHGDGRFFGVMAQDLEKTPAGRSTVRVAPDGTKMVDTSRLAMVNTADLANMHKEIDELRSRIRRVA